MEYFLGVDPGNGGALALYNRDNGELITEPMPTIKAGKGSKKVIDEIKLATFIDNWASKISMAVVEKVHAMPKQGVTSVFTFGMGFGVIKGILAANFIPVTMVPPSVWKRELRVPKVKDAARARASELFPRHAHQWPLKKDDGKAEAAIMAYFGATKL